MTLYDKIQDLYREQAKNRVPLNVQVYVVGLLTATVAKWERELFIPAETFIRWGQIQDVPGESLFEATRLWLVWEGFEVEMGHPTLGLLIKWNLKFEA